MTEIPIITKIIIAVIILAMYALCAYVGLCNLKLRKRIEGVQKDRNELIEERNKLRLRELETLGEFSMPEKKMILAALDMPEYGKAIADPRTSFQARKVYRGLVEKIRESIAR